MAIIQNTIALQDQMTPVLRTIAATLNITLAAMRSIEGTNLGESFGRASSDIRLAERAINETERAMTNFTNSSTRNQQTVTRGFENLSFKIMSVKASLDLLSGVLNSIRSKFEGAFARLDTMETFKSTIEAITGNADAASYALESLKETTLGTAYGLDVAAKATQGFITRGLGVKKATEDLRIWADAVAFYGSGTNQQLETVADAVGKMRTKGSVAMIQLNRLFDAGINAVGIYAQATGRAASVVQDELTKGILRTDAFLDTVTKALNEGTNGVLKIAGAAKSAGGKWSTTFANMKAATTRGMASIITDLEAALKAAELPSLKETVIALGRTIETILKSVGNALKNLAPIIGKIPALLESIKFGISNITYNLDSLKPAIVGITTAVIAFKTAILLTNNNIGNLFRVLTTNPLIWIAVSIGLIVSLVYRWLEANGKLQEAFGIVSNIFSSLIQKMTDGAQWIYDNWSTIEPIFVGLAGGILAAATAWGIYTAAIKIYTVAQWLATGALKAFFTTLLTNPFTWIAVAIGVIIGLIYKWAQSVGGIEIAWAIFADKWLLGWDLIKIWAFKGVYYVMDLWDKMKLKFLQVSIAIQNYMGDLKTNVLVILQNMINGAITLINGFIETVNAIPGVSLELVQQVTFASTAAAENEAAKQARNAALELQTSKTTQLIAEREQTLIRMEQEAMAASFERQAEIARKRAEAEAFKSTGVSKDYSIYQAQTKEILEDFTESAIPDDLITGSGTGGEGKALKTKNTEPLITEEDIKMLADIATRSYRLTYQQLTPQVSIEFSGDIRETVDVDSVAEIIADKITEVATSALNVISSPGMVVTLG